ncbi:periplasmic heavy metal sensor [candidate division TA06 bacterium]|uniref:Periplasmic heavy metal sensor n=1 Tax=candidate division TA06 bacterium TaxID=2250710 RepID=A0A933IFI5_UNCT6|nr:periplasmic heavy metal sensor [candidate division TA06 bacterium]
MKKAITLAVMLLATVGLALAQCPMGPGEGDGPMMEHGGMKDCGNPGMGMGRGQWWENPEVIQKLSLTAEQTEKIDQLALKHRKEMVKLEADMKIARMEYQDLLESNATDSEIRKKSGEMKSLMNKLHDARTEHMLEVRKVLTADQQKKLKAEKTGMRRQMKNNPGCQDKD